MPKVPLARYRHTNLVARDFRRLAAFYEKVFGCTPVPPERDLQGEWLDRATGLEGAHLRGVHLRLPGCGPEGPTLEIFQYERSVAQEEPPANRFGYGHLAFLVPDVDAALAAVLAEGGRPLGQVANVEVPGAGRLTVVYVRDPEGNLLELQRWG
jgi:catechol 2,3-dioxygenase-like lactoylglutathione lyase family enzyme